MIDNKRFWKTVNPLSSDKVKSSDHALKPMMKFCNHPSVSAIRNAFNPQSFSSSKVSAVGVLKEVEKFIR